MRQSIRQCQSTCPKDNRCRQWRMYTPGHPCHGPGFGPKNCWRRINILLRDGTCCMFSIFPLCSRVSFELPLCSRVSFELWVCRRLVFVTTIFKTRPGVQLNPGSATDFQGNKQGNVANLESKITSFRLAIPSAALEWYQFMLMRCL